MAPLTPRAKTSATRLSLFFRPFRQPSSAVIACLGALAAVTVLNVVFAFYTIRTVKDLLPNTREWSTSTGCPEMLLELTSPSKLG